MDVSELKIHPYANLFPRVDKVGLRELIKDIRVNGVLVPVTVYDGRLLDGRNRVAACRIVKCDVPHVIFEGDSTAALSYVLSLNLHRRHLTTSQRSAVAAELASLKLGDNQHSKEGGSIDTASKMLNVGTANVKRAKKVKDADKELFEKVKSGEVSVNAAVTSLKPKQDTRTRTEIDCNRLLSAWDKALLEGRQEFLKTIGVNT